VNVAARLQTLAPPGGICVSGEAHQYTRKALSLTYEDLGEPFGCQCKQQFVPLNGTTPTRVKISDRNTSAPTLPLAT
jgi:class 3 adenylate cyclase